MATKEYQAAYYKKNKARLLAHNAVWRSQNKEYLKEFEKKRSATAERKLQNKK